MKTLLKTKEDPVVFLRKSLAEIERVIAKEISHEERVGNPYLDTDQIILALVEIVILALVETIPQDETSKDQ